MFQFTKFVVVDSTNHPTGMLLVSFRNKYIVYNASRRRVMTDVFRTSRAIDVAMLITDANLSLWFSHDNYRVSPRHVVESLSFADAVLYTNDRYDVNALLRATLMPTSVRDGSRGRIQRQLISNRVDVIVNRYTEKQDGVVHTAEPNARFKGGFYYNAAIYKLARNTFKAFGHLLARAKAGDESITNDQLTHAFFDLDNRYHDFTSHIERAFNALTETGDFGIVHCDCGHYEDENNTHDVRNDTWCDSCFSDDAVFCEDENEYWPRDDCYYSEVRDAYYSYDRDSEGDDDDDDDYDREERSQPIMSYSTNVLDILDTNSGVQSSHFGEFTMGIELEMTSGDSDTRSAAESVRSRLGSEYCIIKSDGSLPSNGFEVVTSPHGLTKHIEVFKAWEIDPTYRAWNTGKCGMHIHIDSRAFTQLTVGKFLMFINSSGNVDFIRKIAGRHPAVDDQARTYCAAEHQSILTNPKKAVKGKSGERYRMVNMMNLGNREARRLGLNMDNSYNGRYNTVELRIFRASLKKERLLAQIEFTHAAVMFCRVASWRDLNGTSFVKWLKTVAGQYPALVKWYGVRNVHTSTPTVIAPAQDTCSDAVPPAPWQPTQTEQRHEHDYPLHIPYDRNAETLLSWVGRNHLYSRFATYAGCEYAYFPYGGDMDRINSGDVVYMRVGELWVLMNEDFASALSGSSYTVSTAPVI